MKRRGVFTLAAAFLCIVTLAPHTVRAADSVEQTAQKQADALISTLSKQRQQAVDQRTATVKKAADAEQAALDKQSASVQKQEQRIKDARVKAFQTACQARVADYKIRLQAIVTTEKQRSDTLDAVLDRVETYVKNKNVAVAQYDTLLTDVQTKKLVVASIYTTAKQNQNTFDCSSLDSAKESLAAFTDIAQQEVNAIKDYKTSVRTLLAAVKTAAVAAEGAK
jgi:hypothetical protein